MSFGLLIVHDEVTLLKERCFSFLLQIIASLSILILSDPAGNNHDILR